MINPREYVASGTDVAMLVYKNRQKPPALTLDCRQIVLFSQRHIKVHTCDQSKMRV